MTDGVSIDRQDGIVVAKVSGEFDISRAVSVRDALVAALENQDFGLVVDLQGTTYLDSAGINTLFELAERLNDRQQRLVAVLPDRAVIRRVVELVKLESVMGIARTVDDARAQVAED